MRRHSLNQLSPSIVAQVRYPQTPSTADVMKYRGKTTRAVANCTKCELHKHSRPIPFEGIARPKFVVVGGEPYGDEETPFSIGGGKMLRAFFRSAGINPTADVMYLNTVSCHPHTEGKSRAPSASETLACRGNLLAQIEAGYTPFVLLVGRALRAFRDDLTVTHHHGEVFVWNDLYVVMPILNPAAVLEGQHQYKGLIKADLDRWRDLVWGDDDPLASIGRFCSDPKCGLEATYWDRDAVPYCGKHWQKGKGQWEKQRLRWSGDPAVQLEIW